MRRMIQFFLLIFAISAAVNISGTWHKRIIYLSDDNEFLENKQIIESLPRPQRYRRAIAELEALNDRSLSRFLLDLDKFDLSSEVVIIEKLWMGNAVIMLTADEQSINSIQTLPSVDKVFKNFVGFEIFDNAFQVYSSPADALEIPWGIERIRVPELWALGVRGKNILVAILDTGVRYTHHDLVGNIWRNEREIPANGLDDDGNGYIDDYFGYDFINDDGDPYDDHGMLRHGTHCAGIVAGDGTEGTQTGVAPESRILAVKIMNYDGIGNAEALLRGLQYSAENFVDVISLSMGFRDPSTTVKNFTRPLMEDLLLIGIPVPTAIGNTGGMYAPPQDIASPADCPSPWARIGEGTDRTATIAVGASGTVDEIYISSARGPTSWNTPDYTDYLYPPGLIKPDIVAPGVAIKSTWGTTDIAYINHSGTSMATPHVAGTIALMLSKNPMATPELVDSIIQTVAVDLGTFGKDNIFGSGRIDAFLSVARVPSPTEPLLVYRSHFVDDPLGDRNGIADPGETVDLIVELYNCGSTALGVNVTLNSNSDYITITDSTASFGTFDIAELVENESDPFQFNISPDTPRGMLAQFTIKATDHLAREWVDTFDVFISLYNRTTYDISTDSVTLTITNFGELGFFDPDNSSSPGQGFTYNGYNYLYGGTAIFAFAEDNTATGEHGILSELLPVSPIKLSTPGEIANRELSCSFVDSKSRLRADMFAHAWLSSSNRYFIILEYIVSNISRSKIENAYFGLYMDYDVREESSVWYDRALWDSSSGLCYMWEQGFTPLHPAYVGIAEVLPVDVGSVIKNSIFVYPSALGWSDSVIYGFLSGSINFECNDSLDDWSLIVGNGPFTLDIDEADTFAYAIIAVPDRVQFLSAAAQAKSFAPAIQTVDEKPINKPKASMIRVSPNPFNSTVCFQFSGIGPFKLTVFDINGRSLLRKEFKNAGSYVWDAREFNSGVYLINLKSGNESVWKKLYFIK